MEKLERPVRKEMVINDEWENKEAGIDLTGFPHRMSGFGRDYQASHFIYGCLEARRRERVYYEHNV